MADIPNYPSNQKKEVPSITNVPAAEEPKPEKVVQGEVATKKPGLGKRLRESFAGDDGATVGQYIVFDVAMPAVKSLIVDIVSQGIERMLWGDTGRTRRTGGNGRSQFTDYAGRSTTRVGRQGAPDPRESTNTDVAGYQDLVFENRADADLTLDRMIEWLRDYGQVSVSNLFDMAGVTPAVSNFQDNKWGWVDLRGISVRGTPRNGYILDLPRPVSLR